jgi:lipid-binding SYLF domain-containing protein
MRQTWLVTSTLLLSSLALNAAPTKDHAEHFREAATVLQEIHHAPDKDIPDSLWEKANCVAVFPSVKKAAFIVGGEYGRGVISCRNGGAWSAPAFMRIEKGSFGLQIGGEAVDLVLLVMNDRGVNHLLADKVALGGEASLAGGPVGRDVRAMTDGQMKAEILSYSRSQGLFAGLDLSGGVITPDRDDNQELYGTGVSTRDILITKRVAPPLEAGPFMAALRRTVNSSH